ncbi:MAG: WecB/TagA/CpsF family glycosyltransferase [Sulfurimonas sp.]|nr:WecB/TagA/CpsF family glycosyltransferase [Sulfurimonas sp.]
MTKRKIIDTLINTGKYETFINRIRQLALKKSSSYVCVSNVHMVVEAHNDESFKKVVNCADMVTPDGMPLAKAMKLLYRIEQDRVAGMDLMPDLLKISEEKDLSIFMYGSTDETLGQVITNARAEFPSLRLYSYSPPFRALSDAEKENVVQMINAANPHFVFVALGCPKQEKWMAEHKGKIHSCMIGLGGALEVYAGIKKRAPMWMQKASLEWLYRLAQDPKRLWKRYLITNTLFILLLLIQIIRVRIFRYNAES